MSWYSARWRRNNNPSTLLPVVAPTTASPPPAPSGVPTTPQAGFAHLLPQTNANDPTGPTRSDRKALEPLFGPNIGAVSSGPAWTSHVDKDKKVLGGGYTTDELTPEVINAWVEKSKDPSQPTTTLQALVNLKRPSLRLVPLSLPSDAVHSQHAMEFAYDADCPRVSIRVHVYLPRGHPDLGGSLNLFLNSPATPTPTASTPGASYGKLLVFETVTEGGFGKRLSIGDGAVVELGRFEKVPKRPGGDDDDKASQALDASSDAAVGREASSSSAVDGLSRLPDASGSQDNAADAAGKRSRRFTKAFRFIKPHHRGHEQELRAAGPALQVVDANAQPEEATPTPASTAPTTTPPKKEEDLGVKLTIRLVALDEQGTELSCPNEQVTYLHVVRVGTRPPAPVLGSEGEKGEEEDARPWVVKVVKREATIGPHTFHLHEIFGLTSASSEAEPTPAPVVHGHTYPPTNGMVGNDMADDPSPSEECLLCLSSPREVVLLPCRHLVACKECALNMVEFGAGGAINQGADAAPPPSATSPASPVSVNGDGGNEGPGGTTGEPSAQGGMVTIMNTVNTRRKRKAKGWFCPVCRQPYTSLLRLTTAPPPATVPPTIATTPSVAPLSPSTAAGATNAGDGTLGVGALSLDGAGPNANEQTAEGSNGLLNSLKPAFFRNLTSGKAVGSNSSSGTNGGIGQGGATEGAEMVPVNDAPSNEAQRVLYRNGF